jgi:hypothetical protein
MFYTFIVLFEKSSTLIDLMDLCKYFISKRRKVTNLALTGWGCYMFFVLVFYCITFLFVSVFYVFFEFFCIFLPIFSAPVSLPFRPLLGFFRAPTVTSFHRALLCTRVNVHAIDFFPCISFSLYSIMLLFFSLYFICYLLVIML